MGKTNLSKESIEKMLQEIPGNIICKGCDFLMLSENDKTGELEFICNRVGHTDELKQPKEFCEDFEDTVRNMVADFDVDEEPSKQESKPEEEVKQEKPKMPKEFIDKLADLLTDKIMEDASIKPQRIFAQELSKLVMPIIQLMEKNLKKPEEFRITITNKGYEFVKLESKMEVLTTKKVSKIKPDKAN